MSFEYFQGWWSLELSGHWFQCLTTLMENLFPYGFNLCPFPLALLLLTPDKSLVLSAVQPSAVAMSTSLLSPPFPARTAPASPHPVTDQKCPVVWSPAHHGDPPSTGLDWVCQAASSTPNYPSLPPHLDTKISALAEIEFHAKFTEHQPGVASPELFDLSALLCNFWHLSTCWEMVTDHICECSFNIKTCEYYAKIIWSLKGDSQEIWIDVTHFQISSMSTWPPFQNGQRCFRVAIRSCLLSPFWKNVSSFIPYVGRKFCFNLKI